MTALADKLRKVREHLLAHEVMAALAELPDPAGIELIVQTALDFHKELEEVKAELREAREDVAKLIGIMKGGSGLLMESTISDAVLQLALMEIQNLSHTDRCEWPHSKEAPCTCHIRIVDAALAKLEKRP